MQKLNKEQEHLRLYQEKITKKKINILWESKKDQQTLIRKLIQFS